MGGTGLRAAVRRARGAVQRYSRKVWSGDRYAMGGWAALRMRVARILTWSIRGVFKNKLSLEAAALTYYTVFSIVPVLVVALWVLKLFGAIHHLTPALPRPSDLTAPEQAPTSAVLLRQTVHGILTAVQNTGRLQIGIAGVAALAYGVGKQVFHMERALDAIAGARDRPPHYRRMLGYLALLALPPALLVVSGVLRALARLPIGNGFARILSGVLAAMPLLRSAASAVIGLAILGLALAILYSSAARARVAWSSALVGGLVGALLLAGVLWVFARLQIGASHQGALQSGMAAIPVFLLWTFSSWLVILIGDQVAIAHELDSILVHGARLWKLNPYDEQIAGVQIMIESTRRALSLGDHATTTNELARRLRLLPASVRDVAGRLRAAGLLRQNEADRHWLACDPARTHLRDVVSAIIGHSADDRSGDARRTGPTLRELAEREAMNPARSDEPLVSRK